MKSKIERFGFFCAAWVLWRTSPRLRGEYWQYVVSAWDTGHTALDFDAWFNDRLFPSEWF